MFSSLQDTGENFYLYVYCFDQLTFDIITSLNISNLIPVLMKDFETEDLLAVKHLRSPGEYCWTCTPHITRDAIRRFGLDQITYLDADLFFFQRPSSLLDELKSKGKSILLTDHRYPPGKENIKAGKYCVQFMTFNNDLPGTTALNWWRDRCLEWCFARYEDGKFGDQKYLDDWKERFEGVHVLEHLGGGVAPWNINNYQISSGPKVNETPVVFYHFHALKILGENKFDLCASNYYLAPKVIEFIYRPYLQSLNQSLRMVRKVKSDFQIYDRGTDYLIQPLLRKLRKRLLRREYIMSA
jgi:hypothetical protein